MRNTFLTETFRRGLAALTLFTLAGLAILPALADDKPKDSGSAQSMPVGKSALAAAAVLLDQLKQAKDAPAAHDLEARIWAAWGSSGDAAIDKLVQQAAILMQVQQYDESLAILDTVVAKAPEFAEGWNKRATLLYIMQKLDRSMADIQKVLTLEPRHFGAIAGIGLISLAKGDKAGALSAYKKVLEINPQNTGAQQSIDALSKELQGNPI